VCNETWETAVSNVQTPKYYSQFRKYSPRSTLELIWILHWDNCVFRFKVTFVFFVFSMNYMILFITVTANLIIPACLLIVWVYDLWPLIPAVASSLPKKSSYAFTTIAQGRRFPQTFEENNPHYYPGLLLCQHVFFNFILCFLNKEISWRGLFLEYCCFYPAFARSIHVGQLKRWKYLKLVSGVWKWIREHWPKPGTHFFLLYRSLSIILQIIQFSSSSFLV